MEPQNRTHAATAANDLLRKYRHALQTIMDECANQGRAVEIAREALGYTRIPGGPDVAIRYGARITVKQWDGRIEEGTFDCVYPWPNAGLVYTWTDERGGLRWCYPDQVARVDGIAAAGPQGQDRRAADR